MRLGRRRFHSRVQPTYAQHSTPKPRGSPRMELFAGDPTIVALRRLLDREAATGLERVEHPADLLCRVLERCLPLNVCNAVFLPADGTRGPHLAIAFEPAFRTYVAFAAEYWLHIA